MTFENILDRNIRKQFVLSNGEEFSSWQLESKIRACCDNFLDEEAAVDGFGEILLTELGHKAVKTGFFIKGIA